MEIQEKKYTRDEILNFNENDWEFRRSSGYAGYDHVNHPKDEQKWIYEDDYMQRKILKRQYEEDYKLISEFRNECLPFGEYPEYIIQEFLNKKYFK